MNLFYAKENILKASKKPPKGPRRIVTKTYTRLSKLSDQMGSAVRVNLVNGITAFKKKIDKDEIADAWEKGDYGAVMATIPWRDLPLDLDETLLGIGLTVQKAATFQLETMPPNINENLRFDMSNPHLRTFIGTRTGSLVRGIQADTQKIIQDNVVRSFNRAMTPRRVAEQIKASIGLDPRRETALDNYRQGLLDQGLSERHFNNLSNAYEERLLESRADAIARTETRLATNYGQLEIWREGARQGFFNGNTVRKIWVVDGNPCDTCEPMDGVEVGLHEPWIITFPNGETQAVDVPSESHPCCECGQEIDFKENKEDNDE